LQERYNASHKIRERSTQFTLWISGMAIGLGWLLISRKTLVLPQKIALSLLIAALFAGTLYFIKGLRRGFQKNRGAMIKCEHALKMHDPDVYLVDSPFIA
jgi:ABC-type Fe3+ transport system permease subunit